MNGLTYANALFETWLLMAWSAVALFAAGTLFVILILLYFLKEERYRRPPRPEKGVEFVAARRAAEARISALAPRVMLLAEKEKAVTNHLKKGTSSEETRRMVEGLLRDVTHAGFWERFVEASALADYDPVRAHEELRRLWTAAETVLETLDRAEEAIYGGEDDKREWRPTVERLALFRANVSCDERWKR